MNETVSLRQTVDVILKTSASFVREFIIVVCKRTTQESIKICEQLKSEFGDQVVVHYQTLPFLGGAIREAFLRARGSHVIMMASDLETDPSLVLEFIKNAQKYPDVIFTASRWREGGQFEGYSPFKLILNWIFQKIFSLLYQTKLSDMTFGYRIFPTDLVQSIRWEELRHAFLFETVIKPMRLGVSVQEIPCVWRARIEGESQNTFFRNFEYFPIGFRVRFSSKKKLLLPFKV